MSARRPSITILPPEDPLPPCSRPIIAAGNLAIVPHPRGGDAAVPLRHGVQIAWAPIDGGGALLPLFFGPELEGGVAVALTREGLRAMITDLQSIEARL